MDSIIIADAELVRIDCLPMVEEYFSSMYLPVKERLDEIMLAPCTEENRVEVEKMRAEVRKLKANIKSALKDAEKQLYEPWERVKERAGEITALCDRADVDLKTKTEAIKDAQKKIMEDDLRAYFEEKCTLLNIEWLTFERMGIHIRLNDSFTALRRTVDNFTEKIAADIGVILTLDNDAEILAEYKQALDLHSSIYTVGERIRRITKEKEHLEGVKKTAQQNEEHIRSVEEAVTEAKTQDPISIPVTVKSSAVWGVGAESKLLEMTFTVSGTLEQMKALKKFLIDNNIKILR